MERMTPDSYSTGWKYNRSRCGYGYRRNFQTKNQQPRHSDRGRDGSAVGQTSTGNNFLQANTNAAISGNVFYDLNGNAARDGGEPGLSGWTINLTGTSSASTTSDANGNYTFQNLAVRSYTVSEVNQTGYTQSEPGGGSYSISILTSTQQAANTDFGNSEKFGPAAHPPQIGVMPITGIQPELRTILPIFIFHREARSISMLPHNVIIFSYKIPGTR